MRAARAILFLILMPGLLLASLHAQEATQRIAELGTCPLTSGQAILDCRVGYRVFGSLNAAKDNAVVMPTWLNGRSDDLIPFFRSEAGPQRLVDTSKYFGVAFDAFGDGVSSSPSNSTKQHGTAFPVFTMEDMVNAQHRVLTQVLGLKHVHAILGLSMGGEQVFAWLVLYPKFMDRAVPIVGTPQVTSFDLLSKQIVIQAIQADPDYRNGDYTVEPKLELANAIGAQMVATPQYRNALLPRDDFNHWIKVIEAPQSQDANDRVWQAKAILKHDLLQGKSLAEIAGTTAGVKQLIIVAAEDRMVTPQPALAWASAISAETYISPGTCAHLIMSCDAKNVSDRVTNFLGKP